ncbi:MAG: InlB B-repeat-containing protein, partial [Clostridia bacterium]|nr:InlB B-repeat-containing protein [Clostridia bacterium]
TGWDVAFNNVTSNLVVTAQYQINTYTVTFKDWDGTVLKTQTVNYGGAATAPADPTREGYTFIGWDVAFNNVTSNLVVTAQYEQNAPSQYLKGDVNCDGIVDSADITLAAAYAMSAGSVTAQGVINGDMNGDGLLTAADLSALYGYIQG